MNEKMGNPSSASHPSNLITGQLVFDRSYTGTCFTLPIKPYIDNKQSLKDNSSIYSINMLLNDNSHKEVHSTQNPSSSACVCTIKRVNSRSTYSTKQKFVLKNWYNTHIDYPYPTQNEKDELMKMTGMNIQQINTWFTNVRKRSKQKPSVMINPAPITSHYFGQTSDVLAFSDNERRATNK